MTKEFLQTQLRRKSEEVTIILFNLNRVSFFCWLGLKTHHFDFLRTTVYEQRIEYLL